MSAKNENTSRIAFRLLGVFLGAALPVFGLLFATMIELDDFSGSAFEYWVPRCLAIVLAATVLGISVIRKRLKFRVVFGIATGFVLSMLYIWAGT